MSCADYKPTSRLERVVANFRGFVAGYNQNMNSTQRLPYLWDYDLDLNQFQEILEGRRAVGRLNQDWAARRLLEYAPYERSSA